MVIVVEMKGTFEETNLSGDMRCQLFFPFCQWKLEKWRVRYLQIVPAIFSFGRGLGEERKSALYLEISVFECLAGELQLGFDMSSSNQHGREVIPLQYECPNCMTILLASEAHLLRTSCYFFTFRSLLSKFNTANHFFHPNSKILFNFYLRSSTGRILETSFNEV